MACVCVCVSSVMGKLFVWNKAFNVEWEARCEQSWVGSVTVFVKFFAAAGPVWQEKIDLSPLPSELAWGLFFFCIHYWMSSNVFFLFFLFLAFPEARWCFPDSWASTLSARVRTIKPSSFHWPTSVQSCILLALVHHFSKPRSTENTHSSTF